MFCIYNVKEFSILVEMKEIKKYKVYRKEKLKFNQNKNKSIRDIESNNTAMLLNVI